jgi:hypothetical protein
MLFNNANASIVGSDFPTVLTTIASFAFLLTQTFLLDPAVLKVVGNARLQWWKVPVRKPISVPLRISNLNDAFSARSFDLSASGVFVTGLRKVVDQTTTDFIQHFQPQETVQLSIYQDGGKSLTCRGRVTRIEKVHGRYPAGMALQFENLTFRDRISLRTFMRSFDSL